MSITTKRDQHKGVWRNTTLAHATDIYRSYDIQVVECNSNPEDGVDILREYDTGDMIMVEIRQVCTAKRIRDAMNRMIEAAEAKAKKEAPE